MTLHVYCFFEIFPSQNTVYPKHLVFLKHIGMNWKVWLLTWGPGLLLLWMQNTASCDRLTSLDMQSQKESTQTSLIFVSTLESFISPNASRSYCRWTKCLLTLILVNFPDIF